MLIEHSPHNSRIHWQQMLSMLSLELTGSSCTLSGRRLPNAQSEKPQFVGCSFKKTAFVKNWRVQLITHMTSPVQPSCFDWGDIFHPSHCVPQSIKMRNIQESVFGVPTVAEWDWRHLGALGCRFDPSPGVAGYMSSIASWVAIAPRIWSPAPELHMPLGSQKI